VDRNEILIIATFNLILLAFCITLYKTLKTRQKILEYLRTKHTPVFNKLFTGRHIDFGLVTSPRVLLSLIKQDCKLFSSEILLDKKMSQYQNRYKRLFLSMLIILAVYIIFFTLIGDIIK